MTADPYAALGAFFTGFEAERLAAALRAGDSTTQALKEIHATDAVTPSGSWPT